MWHLGMNHTNAAVVLAAMVGAAACLSGGDGDGKDTGFDFDSGYYGGWYDSGGDGGDGDGGSGSVGDGYGQYELVISMTCAIAWDVGATYTGTGSDYRWAAALTLNNDGCGGAADTSGELTASGGSAYFQGDYIGVANYGSSNFSWETRGYVTGSGGGFYAYMGYIDW